MKNGSRGSREISSTQNDKKTAFEEKLTYARLTPQNICDILDSMMGTAAPTVWDWD